MRPSLHCCLHCFTVQLSKHSHASLPLLLLEASYSLCQDYAQDCHSRYWTIPCHPFGRLSRDAPSTRLYDCLGIHPRWMGSILPVLQILRISRDCINYLLGNFLPTLISNRPLPFTGSPRSSRTRFTSLCQDSLLRITLWVRPMLLVLAKLPFLLKTLRSKLLGVHSRLPLVPFVTAAWLLPLSRPFARLSVVLRNQVETISTSWPSFVYTVSPVSWAWLKLWSSTLITYVAMVFNTQ